MPAPKAAVIGRVAVVLPCSFFMTQVDRASFLPDWHFLSQPDTEFPGFARMICETH
jgi:hypothetical protein